MYEVIIADDHAVVCTGIQLILNQTVNFRLIDQVRNGDELLQKIALRKYDAVILDVMMPGKDALDVLKEILEINPELPVMIFTMNRDENLAVRMLSHGAMAFVNKESGPGQIIKTLEYIVRGKKVISEHQQQLLTEIGYNHEFIPEDDTKILTDREYQILNFIARGLKSGEIASSLSLSKNTISNHRNNLLKKLRLRNNSDLTRYAMQQGVI